MNDDPDVLSKLIGAKWLPGGAHVGPPLFSPLLGEIRQQIGALVATATPVFFLRDDKRDNSVMQAARDPGRGAWDPARAKNLRAVDDADKPLEIVWEYEWFNAVPDASIAERLISLLHSNVGKRVIDSGLLDSPDEFGSLLIDQVVKPEGPLSIDRYCDTEPLTWREYDSFLSVADAWAMRKRSAKLAGWVEPPPAQALGGYTIAHGSTIRKRHFGDLSQRWHTGAMNIEPFYRRPVPGLGERLEYNFYLHPEAMNEIDLDLAIAGGRVHPELRTTNGFYLAHGQMPGLSLDSLKERVEISKTRRKFQLRDAKSGEIQLIVNVDRIEAKDLQSRYDGSAVYYDVDVSAEGDVLKEPILQQQHRFIRTLRRTWGLLPNDETRFERAERQLRERSQA